jgi:hypothetical protein
LSFQATNDPSLLISQLRKQIRQMDSNLNVRVNTLNQMIGASISTQIVLAKLAGKNVPALLSMVTVIAAEGVLLGPVETS